MNKNITIHLLLAGLFIVGLSIYQPVFAGQKEFDNLRNGMGLQGKKITEVSEAGSLKGENLYIEQKIEINRDIVNQNPGGSLTHAVDLASIILAEENGIKIIFTQRALIPKEGDEVFGNRIDFTAELIDKNGEKLPISIQGSEYPSNVRDSYQGDKSTRSANGSRGRTNSVDWNFNVNLNVGLTTKALIAVFGVPDEIQAQIDRVVALIERSLRNKILYTQNLWEKSQLPPAESDRKTGSIRNPYKGTKSIIAKINNKSNKVSKLVFSGFPSDIYILSDSGHLDGDGNLVIYTVPGKNEINILMDQNIKTPASIAWRGEVNGGVFSGTVNSKTTSRKIIARPVGSSVRAPSTVSTAPSALRPVAAPSTPSTSVLPQFVSPTQITPAAPLPSWLQQSPSIVLPAQQRVVSPTISY